MEQSFECPVCFERFSSIIKPLLIPCGHTVCAQCLEIIKKERNVECPVCRTSFHGLNISALSPNYALIQSDTSGKTITSLQDKIEEIHKQVSSLQALQSKIHDNAFRSKMSIEKIKADLKNKLEMINGIILGIYKSIASEIEGIDLQSRTKIEKIEHQLAVLIEERVELIHVLQKSFSEKSEISAKIKMKLASTSQPDINIGISYYQLESKSFKFEDKLKQFFGSIQEEKAIMESSAENVGKRLEKEGFIGGSEVIRGGFERGGKRAARGMNRGREFREEGKQPRQGRPEEQGWFIENRHGKLEKLPAWFELQITTALDKGENTVNITEKGKLTYMINFQEHKSYRIKKNGKLGRPLQLIFIPE